jgi:hypothetical protein
VRLELIKLNNEHGKGFVFSVHMWSNGNQLNRLMCFFLSHSHKTMERRKLLLLWFMFCLLNVCSYDYDSIRCLFHATYD